MHELSNRRARAAFGCRGSRRNAKWRTPFFPFLSLFFLVALLTEGCMDIPVEATFDIKDMDEVCRLSHGQESAIRAEAQRPHSPHPPTQHSQAFARLPDVPYPCSCVLHTYSCGCVLHTYSCGCILHTCTPQLCTWAAWYIIRLLVTLTPNSVVISFLFSSALTAHM